MFDNNSVLSHHQDNERGNFLSFGNCFSALGGGVSNKSESCRVSLIRALHEQI